MRAWMMIAAGAAMLASAPVLAQWGAGYTPPEAGDPVAFTPGSALSDTLLKRTRKYDIHAPTKRIVIPFFQVQFVNASKATANRTYASASMSYVLDGVSRDEMQAMTDRLYAKFVADLTAKGYTVVPLAEAKAASPALTKLLAAAKPSPFAGKTSDGNVSTIFTAGGTPVYFHIQDPQMGSMANIGSRAYWDQPDATRELNAALVGARFGVTFVKLEDNNKRGFMGMRSKTARVTSDVGLSIMPITTHMWMHSPVQKSGIVGQPIDPVRYYLTSALDLPDEAILSVDDATTGGMKLNDALAGAAGVLGALMNGGDIGGSKTRAYRVHVDPSRFDKEVGAAMESVEAAFVQKVAADL
jgi:hypothetical protein